MSMETRRVIDQEEPSLLGILIRAPNVRGEELRWSIIDDVHVFDALDLVRSYSVENNGRGIIDDAYVFDSFDLVFDSFDLVDGYSLQSNDRRIIDYGYVFDSFDFVHGDSAENNGEVLAVTPTTKDSIENLEKITIDGKEFPSSTDSTPVCSICLEVLAIGSKAIRMPKPCSHVYHQDCILRWLNRSNTCPLCRRSI